MWRVKPIVGNGKPAEEWFLTGWICIITFLKNTYRRFGTMTQSTEQADLAGFRGMFIVLSAKNIKLEAKSSTFQECRTKIRAHLHQVLDWSKADLSNTWVDVGLENTAASEKCTFLHKSRCLASWVHSMR